MTSARSDITELERRVTWLLKHHATRAINGILHWREGGLSLVKTTDGLATLGLVHEDGGYTEVYRRWDINIGPGVKSYLVQETLTRLRRCMVLDDLAQA